jgi:hypothetical protein
MRSPTKKRRKNWEVGRREEQDEGREGDFSAFERHGKIPDFILLLLLKLCTLEFNRWIWKRASEQQALSIEYYDIMKDERWYMKKKISWLDKKGELRI